jgi:peptidoglycan/xylan/chitin deacetylase (PgdA/CDA1 family)
VRRRRRRFRLFVLVYHDVAPNGAGEPEGRISAERFARHVAHLRKHYALESVSQAAMRLGTGGGLERDVVSITFDDGYQGNRRVAAPILGEAGATATFFVTTGFVDGAGLWFDRLARCLETLRRGAVPGAAVARARRLVGEELGDRALGGAPEAALERAKNLAPGALAALLARLEELGLAQGRAATPMSWSEVHELVELGFEVGSHTVSHPILSSLNAEQQAREIAGSRRRLEEALGFPPVSFAYPNGSARDFDATSVELLRHHGFRAACTTIRGCNPPGADPLTLRRLAIGNDSLAGLEARLSGLFDEWARGRWTTGAVGRARQGRAPT